MIWNSIALMTAIDLLVMGITALAVWSVIRGRAAHKAAGTKIAPLVMVIGLVSLGLFYFADLLAMHVLSRFIPMAESMATMEYLHLNFSWLTIPTGIAFIVGGVIYTNQDLNHLFLEFKQSQLNITKELLERQKAERALKRNENRLTQILDTATSGIITIDEMGEIISFNRAAEVIFGYSAIETIGRNVKMLMPQAYAGKYDSFIANYLKTGEARIIGIGREVEGLRKDGSEFPMELGISELEMDGERLFTGLVTDISQRKQAEEELIKAKEEAEKANQAKSEFLSSMSHELRTPMNAILGFAQLMENNPKYPLYESGKESVEQIIKGGDHLLTLIDDVLNLAQIESGQLSLSLEATDPADIFEECLALTRTLAEKQSIEVIDRTLNTELSAVMVDPTRFRQVLLNILSNAVKYNHENGSVILKAKETARGMLCVSVTDTGPGIPKEKQDQLFQPFSRLGLEASDIKGTGIGLTITKQIVELMKGRIHFESAFGKGSTFSVEVPLTEDVPVERKKAQKVQADAQPYNADGHTMLYVEDNPANLKLMETLIGRMEGITMLSAHTGELGLELAEAHKPDVIILDINLPGIDGFHALHRLKESEFTRNIPVIAMTANAMASEIERGLEAGFHRYLTKPIRIHEVTAALENALEAA